MIVIVVDIGGLCDGCGSRNPLVSVFYVSLLILLARVYFRAVFLALVYYSWFPLSLEYSHPNPSIVINTIVSIFMALRLAFVFKTFGQHSRIHSFISLPHDEILV